MGTLKYCLSIIALFLSACGQFSGDKGIYKDIEQIISSGLDFSDIPTGSKGTDFMSGFLAEEFKVVHYLDSADCGECSMKTLHYWRSIMEDPDFADVRFLFVVWSDSYENTGNILANINFKHEVYLDSLGLFAGNNSFLRNKMYNTILVDPWNNIVQIGDIRGNEQLTGIYKEIITGDKK